MSDYQRDLDAQINEARGKGTSINAKKALEILVNKLNMGNGYYNWASLDDGYQSVWQLRTPREDLADEKWLKDEGTDIMHLCRPEKFLESVEKRDKEDSSHFVGYVRDTGNKLQEIEEFKCARCNREMPLNLAKKGRMIVSLHKLGQKV